ncbi:Trm112 family protein [Candidatus Woesearchaeota archaeon]|nr:Trm112 family protein [Candidatus Woesearchaeota archaeon]
MPQDLYEILACPVCKGDIRYTKDKTALYCAQCAVTYPITDGIPVLLPPESAHA